MKLTVYRVTKEIGGTLIEIKTQNTRILIDSGYPLFLKIKFAIRKAFFGDTQEHPYNPQQISEHLMGYIKKNHKECSMNYVPDKDGGFVILSFKTQIENDKDIEELISIIDDMLFVYVAENKKG